MNIQDWRDLSHNLPSYIYLDLGPLQRREHPQVATPWALTIPCLPSSVRCAAAVWQTFFVSVMCVRDCAGGATSPREGVGGAKYKGRHEERQLTSSWSKSPEKVGLSGLCLLSGWEPWRNWWNVHHATGAAESAVITLTYFCCVCIRQNIHQT